MDLQATLQAAREALLAAMPDALAFYAFGSVVRGDARTDSDLDLAVLMPPGRAVPPLLSLLGSLGDTLGRDVDLIDLRSCGDILRMEVLREGRVLYAADADQLLGWEGEAMTDYAEHCDRIRDLVGDFARTGVGYAA